MSITKRQFNLLQAMGIDVWQRRDLSNDTASNANSIAESEQIEANSESYQAPQIIFNDVNIEQLNDTTIFHDILRCLGITFAEVNINNKTINLGLINWQLADTDEITFEHNCLVSPSLEKIAHSSTLKRESMAINRTRKSSMNHLFKAITQEIVPTLMTIENACHPHPWTEKTFRSCIDGRYFGDYLTVNEKIVGFYVGEHVAGESTLMDICVSPSQQGCGYGKQLLLQFLLHCKTLNTTDIFLEVRAKNISAQMLYINHGFNEVSRRTGYYPSNTGFGYEDAIVMKKKI